MDYTGTITILKMFNILVLIWQKHYVESYLQHGHSFHGTSLVFLHTRHLLFWSQQQSPGKEKQGEESRKQAQCLGAPYKTALTGSRNLGDHLPPANDPIAL